MTIHLSKFRFGALILAIALIAPSTAWATHVFIDVPDTSIFAADIEWASTNGITSGTDGIHFEPGDNVTRQESVAFLKRYNDNVAVPEIGNNLFASGANFTGTLSVGDQGLSASVTIPPNHTGVIELTYSAESACYGGDPGSWCQVLLLVDSTPANGAGAFDSNNWGAEDPTSVEGHAITRVSDVLGAGTYVITASSFAIPYVSVPPTFHLDDMILTAEVHLLS